MARQAATTADVSVTSVRLAPVVGPHLPSPLGRVLRLPVVPVSLLADPAFSVIDDQDAARAFVLAATARVDGAVNVVSPGAVTATQAVRMGGRWPVPLLGPEWRVASLISSALVLQPFIISKVTPSLLDLPLDLFLLALELVAIRHR